MDEFYDNDETSVLSYWYENSKRHDAKNEIIYISCEYNDYCW
jgi:hypothetical protein